MGWNARDWFREFTAAPDGQDREAWDAWFTAHGIDPTGVAYATDNPSWSCWVERRDQPGQRQILYTADGVDTLGRPVMAQRVVELVSSPAPFPLP